MHKLPARVSLRFHVPGRAKSLGSTARAANCIVKAANAAGAVARSESSRMWISADETLLLGRLGSTQLVGLADDRKIVLRPPPSTAKCSSPRPPPPSSPLRSAPSRRSPSAPATTPASTCSACPSSTGTRVRRPRLRSAARTSRRRGTSSRRAPTSSCRTTRIRPAPAGGAPRTTRSPSRPQSSRGCSSRSRARAPTS